MNGAIGLGSAAIGVAAMPMNMISSTINSLTGTNMLPVAAGAENMTMMSLAETFNPKNIASNMIPPQMINMLPESVQNALGVQNNSNVYFDGGEVYQDGGLQNVSLMTGEQNQKEDQLKYQSDNKTKYQKDGILGNTWEFVKGFANSSIITGCNIYKMCGGELGDTGKKIYSNAIRSNVTTKFDDALEGTEGMSGADKFKNVTDRLVDEMQNNKYYDDQELAYTYASLMENLGIEFDYRKSNGLKYSQSIPDEIFGTDDKLMNAIPAMDCTRFQNVGLNILGITNSSNRNVTLQHDNENAARNNFKSSLGLNEQTIRGTSNLRFNNEVFDIFSVSEAENMDKIGMIADLKYEGGQYNHVAAIIFPDPAKGYSAISDSHDDGKGAERRRLPNDWINNNSSADNEINLYLKIKLKADKKSWW